MIKYKLALMRSTPTDPGVSIRDARKSVAVFLLTAAHRKDSNETAAKGGTRQDEIADWQV
jgi:hypothetical protein